MPALAPLNADAVIRLVAESPGIRLGAALDACRDSGFRLSETSAIFRRLINAGRIQLTADRRLYAL